MNELRKIRKNKTKIKRTQKSKDDNFNDKTTCTR